MKTLFAILALTVSTFAQQIQITGGVSISGNTTTVAAPAPIIPQPPPSPLGIVGPLPLPSCTVGIPCSIQLQGANGTAPYYWTAPGSGNSSSGLVDILDYAAPTTRNSSHLSAPSLYKAFHVDAGMLWWIKNSPGNPWDLEAYDGSNLYWWITECGDAACQSHCPGNNCFTDPKTYKQYQTPVPLVPRYFNTAVNTIGNPSIIITAGPNTINRVTGCSLLDTVNIGTIEGLSWYNGSTTVGPDGNGNSITANAIIIDYFYGLTTTGASPTGGSKEEYTLQLGYGQTKWTHATWNGSSYVIDQTKIQATITTGGAPTVNFGCNVPNYPLSGGLPPGNVIPSAPQLNFDNIAGLISGIPTTAGTYNFTAQIEDSKQQYTTQSFQLVVQPAATITSITVTPASPSIVAGNTQAFLATCNYSDGSSLTCGLPNLPTWSSSSTATATIDSAGTATGVAAGTTTIKAQIGSVSGTTVLTVTSPGPPPPTQTSTSVAPANSTLNVGQTLQYVATAVFNDGSTAPCPSATWVSTATSKATIVAATGLATGVAAGTTTIQGTCNSILGSTTLTVQTAPLPLTIQQTTIPNGTVNSTYPTTTLTATGGTGSGYSWSTSAGTWPPGITPITSGGVIAGTPTQAGTFNVTVQVHDSGSGIASQQYTIVINSQVVSSGGDNRYASGSDACTGLPADGPVTNVLTKCFFTPLSATPSPGTVRTTTAANLASTYAAAACGDVIKVTGGTSNTGPITLTGKGCDNAHWITIEGSGVVSDVNFPTEGTRSSPCFSNVSSLPNRPAYPCGSPASDTAKFIATSATSALLLQGADHLRFIGIEATRVTTPGTIIYAIIDLTSNGTQTNNIIFDRCWIHGVNSDGTFPQTPATDTSTTRGIYLGQSNHIAVIDSYMSDFYNNGSVASNGQTDAQAITGGVGGIANSGWGVYKFVNNHLEGASEGILLGGDAGPPVTPTGCTNGVNCNLDVPQNVEVRRNLFFASTNWNGNGVGTGYPNRKNGIEFKMGANVLLEANVMEHCWFNSQPWCYVFDFAPKNQQNTNTDPGLAPTARVQDAVARYNYGYDYPGHQIALYTTNRNGGCQGCGLTVGNARISIHDNLVGDKLAGGQSATQPCVELFAEAGPITFVSVRHNTCVNAGGVSGNSGYMMPFGGLTKGQLDNYTFQDNLMAMGTYGVISIHSGGGCEQNNTADNFLVFLQNCTNTFTVNHNALFKWSTPDLGGTLGNLWPTDGHGANNFFSTGTSTVQFVNYGTGDSSMTPGNYALQNTSPYHNAASDGSDIGANITQLNSEISHVADY